MALGQSRGKKDQEIINTLLREVYQKGGSPECCIVKMPNGEYVMVTFTGSGPIFADTAPLKDGHYYWIRFPGSLWEPAEWVGDGFYRIGRDCLVASYSGLDEIEVGEEIVPPKEDK
jgi:hypothetical protein